MSVRTKPSDPLQDPEVLGSVQRTGVADGLPPPGVLDNAVEATLTGIPHGLAQAGAALDMAGNMANRATTALVSPFFPKESIDFIEQINEAERQDIVADLGRVEERFRPDPVTTGAAGQIGHELAAIVPRTAVGTAAGGPIGGFIAAGGPAGLAESARLQAEGVDPLVADTTGLITGTTTGIGAVLPGGGFVKGALPDTAAALAGNVGLGVAQRGSTHLVLEANGYHDQAAQYRALDGTALATDAAFSLLLSGAHRLTAGQVDSALVNKNADSFARGDGLVPTTGAAARAADAAKAAALNDILAGRPVNVADHVVDAEMMRDPFHAAPKLPTEVRAAARAADPTADQFELAAGRIIGLESGGRATAKNPASSATGAGQFIESTWLATIKRARPDLAEGKTRAQLLELRNDPDLSHAMTVELARENGAALRAAGVEVTPDTLYAAHHFGAERAVKFAEAAGDTPIEKILTPAQIKANRYLVGKTKDEVLANWAKRAGEEGGGARAAIADAAPPPPELVSARRVLEDLDREPTAVRVESGLRVSREGDSFRIEDFRTLGRAAEGAPAPRIQPAVLKREDAELAIASAVRTASPRKPEAAATPLPDHPDVHAAQQLAAEVPEHPILTGYDADAKPVFRSLHEAVTEIQTEHAAAVNEAEAYTAGANCFLRQGAA